MDENSSLRAALKRNTLIVRLWRAFYSRLYVPVSGLLSAALFQVRVALAKKAGIDVVHLVKIRKTGGTALVSCLGRYHRTSTHAFFYHSHFYRFRDVPVGEKALFVVRDPVERFVSGFNCRLRRGAPSHHYPWTPAEQRAFSIFSTPNDLAEALSDPARSELARQAFSDISHLSFPLTYWLDSVAYLESRKGDFYCLFTERLDQRFRATQGHSTPAQRDKPTGYVPGSPSCAYRFSPAPIGTGC